MVGSKSSFFKFFDIKKPQNPLTIFLNRYKDMTFFNNLYQKI